MEKLQVLQSVSPISRENFIVSHDVIIAFLKSSRQRLRCWRYHDIKTMAKWPKGIGVTWSLFYSTLNTTLKTITYFYAPGLKGPPGPSSNRIICPSVIWSRLHIRFNVQRLGWSYSHQTWTVSSFKGWSHGPDITCPWDGAGSKCGTWRFCQILTLLLLVASMFYKHMSRFVHFL